jgi:hypothetical protein
LWSKASQTSSKKGFNREATNRVMSVTAKFSFASAKKGHEREYRSRGKQLEFYLHRARIYYYWVEPQIAFSVIWILLRNQPESNFVLGGHGIHQCDIFWGNTVDSKQHPLDQLRFILVRLWVLCRRLPRHLSTVK